MNLVERHPSWVTMGIQVLVAGVVALAAVEALVRSLAGCWPEAARKRLGPRSAMQDRAHDRRRQAIQAMR